MSDSSINGQIIHLTDLLAPGAKPIISNRTFEECEIRGPAMVVLMGTTLADNTWEGDIESLFIEVADERMIIGAIGLRGCVFRKCHFTQIGIIGTKKQVEEAKRGFGPKLLKEATGG